MNTKFQYYNKSLKKNCDAYRDKGRAKKKEVDQTKKTKERVGGYIQNLFLLFSFEQFHLCTQCARSKAKGALVWSMRARGEL
jgi:hypothetical protein